MPANLSKLVSSAKATLASFLLLKLGQLAAVQEFCPGYLLCLEPLVHGCSLGLLPTAFHFPVAVLTSEGHIYIYGPQNTFEW